MLVTMKSHKWTERYQQLLIYSLRLKRKVTKNGRLFSAVVTTIITIIIIIIITKTAVTREMNCFEILLKLFQCFISHVTNKTQK